MHGGGGCRELSIPVAYRLADQLVLGRSLNQPLRVVLGETARAHQVDAMFFVVTPDAGELAQLAGLVDQGRLRPVVSQTFPLSEGRRAFESGGQHRPPGKTVLAVR